MRTYSLLVVDDEIFAVRGITEGIRWEELGIQSVYGVCNVQEAMKLMQERAVDVVISDIEMPKENGLDLLAWITKEYPKVKVLLLTAYARFDYAAQALHYQAADYILKPVVHEELKKIVKKCLEKIRKEEEESEELEQLRSVLPLLVEKFWTDILDGRTSVYPEQIRDLKRIRELKEYVTIPESMEDFVTPVLFIPGVHAGMMETEQKGREILAQIQTEKKGILGGASGIFREEMLLLFVCRRFSEEDISELESALEEIEACGRIRFQMCIGPNVRLEELPAVCETLLFRSDAAGTDRVFFYEEAKELGDIMGRFPLVVDWIPMLESGKEAEFSEHLQKLFGELKKREPVGRKELLEIYTGFWYSFTVASRRNALSGMSRSLAGQDRSSYRSVEALMEWCGKIRDMYFLELNKSDKKNSTMAEKVEKYVMEHISEDFKREDIANALYFNPSYLSHIFKQEKGISLNKFINQIRIQEAKRLFETTNLPVGTVAMDTGYYNFSYFSKQFKEMYHVTPSEFKKMVENKGH